MQGSDLQVGWCFERAQNIPGDTINNFLEAKSVTGIVPMRPPERSGNIARKRAPQPGRNLKVSVSRKINYDPDVDSIVRRRANHYGYYEIGAPLAGGLVHPWLVRPPAAGESPATYVRTMNSEITDGRTTPFVTGEAITEMELKLQDGKIAEVSETLLGCFYTHASAAVVETASVTYTGAPHLIGMFKKGVDPAVPLKMKVEAAAGGGYDGYVRFTTGVTAYAGANIPVKFDDYTRIVLGDGSSYGLERSDDLWVVLPSGEGVLDVGTEWAFYPTRTLSVPTFSSREFLDAANFTIAIDGVEYGGIPNRPGFMDGTLKVTNPRAQNYGGGKYPHGLLDNGDVTATLKLGRNREDLLLLQKMENAERVAIIIDIAGLPIGNTGYYDRWKITIPAMEPTTGRDVTSKLTLKEDADLYAVDPGGLTPIIQEQLWCGVATI